ncbi:MAG: MarR family transcriptional regulator [Bacteroidetes bacterium]|jgi:DNA-binding MarR family transcriptional regulator|nr:MarR family transcriptional regulator [Bacteroidota bacterium]
MTLPPQHGQHEAKGDTHNDAVSKHRLRIWLRFLDTNRTMQSHLRTSLRNDFDTTLPRFDVLATLDRYRDGLRMSHLSAHLKVSNGNVTGIIDSLIREGHVIREVSPEDKRAATVRLTKRGIERFAEMATSHEEWVNKMFAGMDSDDLDQFAGLLDLLEER